MFQLSPLKNMLFVNSYLSLRLIPDMILPFSNNCDKELIPLLEILENVLQYRQF